MERNGKTGCTTSVEEAGNERSPRSQSVTKPTSLAHSKEWPQEQPSRSGLARGRRASHQAAPLRRGSLAELGSYMVLGVNVSLNFQVPN